MATVVVTGGSRGIGAAVVARYAARGDRVYFLYEKNHEAARAVSEKTGATRICCDVADSGAVAEAFSNIPEVDILVCNAGVCWYGLLTDMPETAWDRIFAVNVKGICNCVKAAMPAFLRKHSGSIVTVSSMGGCMQYTHPYIIPSTSSMMRRSLQRRGTLCCPPSLPLLFSQRSNSPFGAAITSRRCSVRFL